MNSNKLTSVYETQLKELTIVHNLSQRDDNLKTIVLLKEFKDEKT